MVLTEAHCILGPTASVLEDFSLRFSIVSPSTVIDQTFDLLRKLNDIRSIKVQDTEIKNHRYRQLRIAGKVDNWFRGLEGTDEEAEIEQSSYIEIDAEKFLQNQPGIMKRQIIANNDKGEVIEGGDKTIRFIEKKGLFHRFLGWIKNEL